MAKFHEIMFTPADGEPEDLGFSGRDVLEPIDPYAFKEDRRQKLVLIGDFIASLASEPLTESDITRVLHQLIIVGRINVSGHATFRPLNEALETIQIPFRAIMPSKLFGSLYESERYEQTALYYRYNSDDPIDQYVEFDWRLSQIEYGAQGYEVDENGEEWKTMLTPFNWQCTWSNIMLPKDQAVDAISRKFPSLRRYVKPTSRPTVSIEDIKSKMDEMHKGGMNAGEIYKNIRNEPGFENVTYGEAKKWGTGRWKRGPNSR